MWLLGLHLFGCVLGRLGMERRLIKHYSNCCRPPPHIVIKVNDIEIYWGYSNHILYCIVMQPTNLYYMYTSRIYVISIHLQPILSFRAGWPDTFSCIVLVNRCNSHRNVHTLGAYSLWSGTRPCVAHYVGNRSCSYTNQTIEQRTFHYITDVVMNEIYLIS